VTYDVMNGEPYPAVIEMGRIQWQRIELLVDEGVGVKVYECGKEVMPMPVQEPDRNPFQPPVKSKRGVHRAR
jgi:hypothetical protein